jgi:hypothetical protein
LNIQKNNTLESMSLNHEHLAISCAWIRENWNATNLDVPEMLRNLWTENGGQQPSDLQLAVLSFGLTHWGARSCARTAKTAFGISPSTVLERFPAWRTKLALAEVHYRSDLRTSPLPLFEFPPDEQIRFSLSAD